MNKSPSELLTQTLDPNREVDPGFVQYSVVDRRGRVHTGMIASETATSLTLKAADNKQQTVLRADIDQIINSGKSLMPEGLEEKIDLQQMADLLSYLGHIQYDLGTEAGMTEEPKRKPAKKPTPQPQDRLRIRR